jgi:hypothetical protein
MDEKWNESGLSAAIEHIRQQMDAFAQTLAETFQGLSIDWDTVQAQMLRSTEQLARLGWTLPMNFTPAELVELANGNTDHEIEKYMVDYFIADNGKYFLGLRGRVLSRGNLIRWRVLLDQCFEAYNRGHYLVIIPALLSVIEGCVAEAAGKIKSSEVASNKFASDLEKGSTAGSMRFLVWRSVRMVLDKLFASSNFGGPNPRELNRHWILHGRDHTQWTRTDALRLFNLLDTIRN